MADQKISQFTEVTTPIGSDYFPLVRAGVNKRLTLTNLFSSALITAGLGFTPLNAANNLSDVANVGLARASLGLGTMAIQNAAAVNITGGSISGINFGSGFSVSGIVTATAFVGNGAGLTGIGTGTGGIINTGSTTIGADSDSDGVGVIDLQTRGTTRVRVLNNGGLQVFGNLGLNSATPGVPLEIKVHYAADTTSMEELIRFVTPTGHDPFQFYQRTTMFGDDRTDSVGIGFSPAGAPQSSPSFGLLFEDSFGTPDPQFEWHLQTQTPTGGSDRPLTVNVDRETGYTRWSISAAEITFATGHLAEAGVNAILMSNSLIQTQALNGGWELVSDSTKFTTENNGGSTAKQIGIYPLPGDDEQSWLVFGDHGAAEDGVSIAKRDASSLTIYQTGATLNPGSWRAGRFYGYGTTWGANPTVIVGEDIRLVSASMINFAATSDPNNIDTFLQRSGVGGVIVFAPLTGAWGIFRAHTFEADSGGSVKIDSLQVVGAQGAAVANATDAASAITQLNALLARLRTHGLIAT